MAMGLRSHVAASLLGGCLFIACTTLASAEQVARERDIVDLRLGQRVFVDDGSCPQGQIKEVTGAKLSASGVVRRIICVPRPGARR